MLRALLHNPYHLQRSLKAPSRVVWKARLLPPLLLGIQGLLPLRDSIWLYLCTTLALTFPLVL